jgi:hypothetical protein
VKATNTEDPYRDLRFVESRIPALDAIAAFVPKGQDDEPWVEAAISAKGFSRWFPVDDGHKVLVPYEGQNFDAERFQIEKGAWDHEHCKACGADIEPLTLCWVTESGPFVILCDSCHAQRRTT